MRGTVTSSLPTPPTQDRPALHAGDRVLVLVNPAAWRTRAGTWQQSLAAALSPGIEADWATPARAEDVGEIITRARGTGTKAVLVAGGDGTVSRSIEALAGTDMLLGVLPLGTGNDLARELGVPIDIDAAIAHVVSGHERAFDVVDVNGRPYATVGLVGLTAGSAVRVVRWQAAGGWRQLLGRLLGRQAYRVSGALSLVKPGRAWRRCRVTIDGPVGPRTVDEDVFGLFITNGRRLGSGLVLPVDASTDDGRFEVCVVRRVNRFKLIAAFACFTQGWRLPPGVLDVHPAASAVVEWPEQTTFSADGEALLDGQRFTLRIRSRALRVIA
jgi:diacylglycerol kinase family enzyme